MKINREDIKDKQYSLKEYLAGYIYGDGNLYYDRKKREYLIRAYDRVRGQLEIIADIIEYLYRVRVSIGKRKDGDSWELRIRNKRLYIELKNIIDKCRRYPTKDFIAGFYDAGGYLYIRKSKFEAGITITDLQILIKIRHELDKHNIKSHIHKRVFKNPQRTVYYLRIYGRRNVSSFLKYIKPKHPKYNLNSLPRAR